jgi:hypothetical protein
MPGGLGLVEVTTIGLLSASGLPPSVATLGVLGWRLVNFWLPIPVGAGCYISLRGSRAAGLVGSGRTLRTMTSEARSGTPEAPTAEGSLSE